MKKILITLITAAMLVSSAGCQVQQPQATQSAPEPAPQAIVLNVESSSEKHPDTSTVMEQITAGLKVKLDTPEKENVVTQVAKEEPKASPIAEQEKAQGPQNKPEMRQSSPTAESKQETPASEPDAYLKVTVKATPTPPPAATPAPTPAPTPEPPAPTPAPVELTPEPVPSFDIDYWIGYAQSYAQGLGLRLESSAVDCWDNPIGAGPHSTCLERDISTRMNRYASDPDITDVWIWYESIGENSYNIYIGYA